MKGIVSEHVSRQAIESLSCYLYIITEQGVMIDSSLTSIRAARSALLSAGSGKTFYKPYFMTNYRSTHHSVFRQNYSHFAPDKSEFTFSAIIPLGRV